MIYHITGAGMERMNSMNNYERKQFEKHTLEYCKIYKDVNKKLKNVSQIIFKSKRIDRQQKIVLLKLLQKIVRDIGGGHKHLSTAYTHLAEVMKNLL
jgi:hypothetical protein